jgi:hypothetical protein
MYGLMSGHHVDGRDVAPVQHFRCAVTTTGRHTVASSGPKAGIPDNSAGSGVCALLLK